MRGIVSQCLKSHGEKLFSLPAADASSTRESATVPSPAICSTRRCVGLSSTPAYLPKPVRNTAPFCLGVVGAGAATEVKAETEDADMVIWNEGAPPPICALGDGAGVVGVGVGAGVVGGDGVMVGTGVGAVVGVGVGIGAGVGAGIDSGVGAEVGDGSVLALALQLVLLLGSVQELVLASA